MSKNDKTIADKLHELDELVLWFECEDLPIEEAVKKFAEAEQLAENIQAELEKLENKIEQIKEKFN